MSRAAIDALSGAEVTVSLSQDGTSNVISRDSSTTNGSGLAGLTFSKMALEQAADPAVKRFFVLMLPVTLTLGLFSLTGMEFDLNIVAALLIVGIMFLAYRLAGFNGLPIVAP